MSKNAPVRVGLVGAGANSRSRHIPGFQSLDGVEVTGVSNRTKESGQVIADEFGIPNVFDDWNELIRSPNVDAICIGTWPYMHCPITIAALEAGKHVLTEARMAMSSTEAKAMLETSRKHPKLISQIVPSPFTFKVDATINDLILSGYLGSIISIELRSTQSNFPDFGGDLHWRNNRIFSGYNILNMGIWYESMIRWVGPAVKIYASTSISVNRRLDVTGAMQVVTVPDHVEILCDMAIGAKAHLTFSAVTGLDNKSGIWLFGTEGTIYLDTSSMSLYCGNRTGKKLEQVVIPADKQGHWRVEEEFINAIRGEEQVKLTTFEAGLAYMEFSEAVSRSSERGMPISLPL